MTGWVYGSAQKRPAWHIDAKAGRFGVWAARYSAGMSIIGEEYPCRRRVFSWEKPCFTQIKKEIEYSVHETRRLSYNDIEVYSLILV